MLLGPYPTIFSPHVPPTALRIRFTSVADSVRLSETVTVYVDEAMGVEESGVEVGPALDLVLVEELQNVRPQDP